MFQWSNKVNRTVTFNQEFADQTLLAVIETELQKQPHKTFSDLCKEALRQVFCDPAFPQPRPSNLETAQPATQPRPESIEQQVNELQRQFINLEQRFLAKEAGRLDAIESQLHQLALQVAQLSVITNQQPISQPSVQSESKSEAEGPTAPQATAQATPQEADPLLNHLSSLVDNF